MGGTKLCDGDGALTRITIIFPQGDISRLTMDTYGTLAGTINLKSNGAYSMVDPAQESVKGTREFSECSNRGECDYDMGICKCMRQYRYFG